MAANQQNNGNETSNGVLNKKKNRFTFLRWKKKNEKPNGTPPVSEKKEDTTTKENETLEDETTSAAKKYADDEKSDKKQEPESSQKDTGKESDKSETKTNSNQKNTEHVKPEPGSFYSFGRISVLSTDQDIAVTHQRLIEDIRLNSVELMKIGEDDGKMGLQAQNLDIIISSYIASLRRYVFSVFKKKFEAINHELISQQQISSLAEKQFLAQEDHVAFMKKKYRWNNKKFHVFLGALYLFIGVCLIAADIPLSLNVTRKVFNIENHVHEYFLVIGITLLSFYIKVYYDEYLAFPVEKAVMFIKLKNLHGTEKRFDLFRASTASLIRFFLKTALLITCLGTIWLLGQARHKIHLYEVIKKQDNKKNETTNSPRKQSRTELPVAQNTGTDILRKTLMAIQESLPVKLSYILLSILFPFIGGVLFSLGFDQIKNVKELKLCEKKLDEELEKYSEQRLKENSLVQKKEIAEGYIEWMKDNNDFGSEYIAHFKFCYQYGFEKGVLIKNNSFDQYSIAESIRKTKLMVELRNLQNKLSQSQFQAN
jgi:hypothetical protein